MEPNRSFTKSLLNYVKVCLFLIDSLIFWLLFGWLADYSFPFSQALELILACFKGTISSRINSLQQQLQRVELVSQPDNKQQVQKLNNLESQAWLYQGVLERLGSNSAANHGKIARTIEALEFKRNEILRELEPRKPQKYRNFSNIQNHVRSLLASQAEKDYEKLDTVVTNVLLFTRSRQPSRKIFSEVIAKIAVEITQNANYISPYRIRLAYKIDDLIKILSTKLLLEVSDSTTVENYQGLVDELQSRIDLPSQQFNNLLCSRQESIKDRNKLTQEIANLTQTISDLSGRISERDSNIDTLREKAQNLAETAQRKQEQMDDLQNLLADLRRKFQNASESNQSKQNQINNLQNQLFQLKKKNSELQEQIRNSDSRESEVERLQSEKYQLSLQKSELQERYQELLRKYQQKQLEITDLKNQIKNSSQQADRKVETKKQISVEEYAKISNKSDYVYVKAYTRKDGTYVRAHYRRRPNG